MFILPIVFILNYLNISIFKMTKKLSKCKPRHIPIDLELLPEINLCIDKPNVHIRHTRCKTKCHRSKHKRKCKCKCKCNHSNHSNNHNHSHNHSHKCDDDSNSYYSSDFSDSHAIL
jgi:hypothetical protein